MDFGLGYPRERQVSILFYFDGNGGATVSQRGGETVEMRHIPLLSHLIQSRGQELVTSGVVLFQFCQRFDVDQNIASR